MSKLTLEYGQAMCVATALMVNQLHHSTTLTMSMEDVQALIWCDRVANAEAMADLADAGTESAVMEMYTRLLVRCSEAVCNNPG